jgi:hypothetical protein
MHALLGEFGYRLSLDEVKTMMTRREGYIEPLLELVGAKNIRTFDISNYQQATDIHDLNDPIAPEFHGRFSVVLDSGTLEHVFNFPQALKSSMEMVREGGHFVCMTMANNSFGHGLYQFGPGIFCRVFTENYGFQLVKIFAAFETPRSPWWEVVDETGLICNTRLTYLMIIAKKIRSVPLFHPNPQQRFADIGVPMSTGESLYSRMPYIVRAAYRVWRDVMERPDPRHFRKVRVP